MANLTEGSTWTANIYQLERTDKWDAGVSGAGLANTQFLALANRTQYLKAEIEKRWNREHFQIAYADQLVGASVVKFAKGTAYTLADPLADWDYATPNDGLTRDYIVHMSCVLGNDFTLGSSTVAMSIITTNAGPTLVTLCSAFSFQPGSVLCAQKKVTVGPNKKIAGLINVGAVGASVNIYNAVFRIEEVIKA